MVSQGIYSIVLLIFSNVFMTFAWYGHLKMKQEFSWFAALPLIGVIAFSWAVAFFEYCLQVPANRLGFRDNGGPFDIMQLKVIQEVITLAVFTLFSVWAFKTELKWNHLAAFAQPGFGNYFVFQVVSQKVHYSSANLSACLRRSSIIRVVSFFTVSCRVGI